VLADKIQSYLRAQMPRGASTIRRRDMTVAVMGCVVNGPGESKMANIGISLPARGAAGGARVRRRSRRPSRSRASRIAEEFQQIVFDYVRATYGGEPPRRTCSPRGSRSESSHV
jgi:(E)-4-hydroxy-3-methylbut-2-enyl-diphosphate synthase